MTRLLDAAEIAYVEVRQHDLLYNLCGGDGKTEIIKNRGSMQEIAAQLTPYGFVRCSASYLVNLRCITAVSRMNVYIGGAALPIGRTYKDAFTEAFSRYMAKRSGKTRAGHKLDTEPANPAGYDFMRLPVCPVGQRRSCFVPRLAAGVWTFLALTDTLAFLPLWAKLLLYTTLLFDLIWFSFDCSPLHALFYTTCAYAVQHIASKLAYMPIGWLVHHGRTDRLDSFFILLFSNLVVCLVIYRLLTLRIRRGRLLFDNVKTVLYSGFFLIAAVYLSVVLEDVLDSSAESYLTAYLALNAFCILFAITILALEFSNCSIKSLEHENEMLAQLLECDKQQYEQAKKHGKNQHPLP